jgi:acyl-CoA hydrolase
MDNFTLVRPEHLNHHGYLFGGVLLKWVDEYAWLVAARDFTGCWLATAGMHAIAFGNGGYTGPILAFLFCRCMSVRLQSVTASTFMPMPPVHAKRSMSFQRRSPSSISMRRA